MLQALKGAHIVMTIHGLKNSIDKFLIIGGLDTAFGTELRVAIQHKGFIVRESEQAYGGVRTTNICNRGCTGKGAQLEITFALRKRIFEDAECRIRFIETVRLVIKGRK